MPNCNESFSRLSFNDGSLDPQGGYRQGMFEMLLKQVESPDDKLYLVFLNTTALQSHKQYNHSLA